LYGVWEQKTDRFRRAKITSDETNETIRDITLKNLSPIPIITDATPTPEHVQASQVLDLPSDLQRPGRDAPHGRVALLWSMIRKSGYRFSEKIMLKSRKWSGTIFEEKSSY
jgi:hypothetical protein